ncbi:MAG TPA: energy-coupling factor transporter transmembrane component T [Solirubrobacteraceae bacterium]|nr:energy-coupling factor transporter transmembrane component T [Solirubrobacteraceae bacterium]
MRYRAATSPLHATRASVAVAWSAALAGLALVFDHPLVTAAVLLAATAAGTLAGVRGELRTAARVGLLLALMFAVINPFVARLGLTVLLRLGELPPFGQIDITLEATIYGVVQGLRILALVVAVAVYFAAVDPDRVLRLFRRAGFRSALTVTLATRLVPVLVHDGRRLADAQRCRPRPSGRLALVRAVSSSALDRAVDVAATLELRGYGTAWRARGVPEPWSRHDVAFAASAAALAGLAATALATGLFAWHAYPTIELAAGVPEITVAAAIAVVALLPFAERRGVAR